MDIIKHEYHRPHAKAKERRRSFKEESPVKLFRFRKRKKFSISLDRPKASVEPHTFFKASDKSVLQ